MFHRYCKVIIFLLLQLSYVVYADEAKAETETENALNVTITETNSTTSLPPVAEALVRYRRQPTRTVIKHIVRPKRIKVKRVKRPKIKYSFAEPPPTYYRSKPSFNRHKAPTYESSVFEDFSHYNVESGFHLPPSSYEAQSMDLDLYKNYEAQAESSYKDYPKPSSYEYAGPEVSYKEPDIHEPTSYVYSDPEISYKEPEISYKEIQRPPTYSYAEPEISYKPPKGYYKEPEKTRKPHTKYGVPTEFVYSSDYDKPSGNKYSYEPPPSFHPSKPIYQEIEKPTYTQPSKDEYSYEAPGKDEYSFSIPKEAHPPRIPATKYGVPDVYIPATAINDYNKYSVVEQKPSYVSHTPAKPGKYNFAEPPQPEHVENVEITYSPSYEIHIPPSNGNKYSSGSYNVEHQSPPGSYEEPTQQYHPQPPSHPQQPSYENPKQQYDTSSNSHPSSDYPQQHPGYQESSDTNQPPTYHPAPPGHGSISEYIPQSQDLPINVNHKQPSYGYTKSSYEVPIYDPLPFDTSNNQDQEIYPPQTYDHSKRQQNSHVEYVAEPNNVSEQRPSLHQHQPESEETPAGDAHSSGTRPLPQATSQKPKSPIARVRKTRKRKRNKGSSTTISTTKHVLDVPELKQAFENEQRNQIPNDDIDANESHKIQSINTNSGPWNPMKIRTSPSVDTTPSTTAAINNLSTKSKRFQYKQRSTTTTTTPKPLKHENNEPKSEIVSFEKSRSKSYYDGILSTPRVYNTNLFRNRSKKENTPTASTPTQMVTTNEKKFYKRTTKNVFDTTAFKSPLTDRDVYRNLPKNHKLF